VISVIFVSKQLEIGIYFRSQAPFSSQPHLALRQTGNRMAIRLQLAAISCEVKEFADVVTPHLWASEPV
jgi:hypothetical protein